MAPRIRLCLCLHNHQPIGNFDQVFEDAYQDSYLPFLEVFEPYEHLKIALHTSGPLLEWLDEHHPDYLDRVAALVAYGRLEIIGGAFYEPILTMIPRRDRVGQIRRFAQFLEHRFAGAVQGMWMPERVWEASLVSDLAAAGVRYTLVDDFHFKNAGLREEQLHGYYLSEDEGRTLVILPGSEHLRYTLPFAPPEETIRYLSEIAEQQPGSLVVFGDDGEKFGTWPDTKHHVYEEGWLRRMFDAFTENLDWLELCTPSEALGKVAPLGKIYLPDSSYREMSEWSLPVDRQVEFENLKHDMENDHRWGQIHGFIRGGFWRNFKVKYPEANEMYSRMMVVSERLEQVSSACDQTDGNAEQRELLDQARRELYRGQCNCPYWHGAFGGIYLPHLRNATFQHLLAAENILEQMDAAEGSPLQHNPPTARTDAIAADFDFDGRQEIRLGNDRLVAWLAPARGGQVYELDVRDICHNLLATMTRRPEAYHQKVLAGAHQGGENCASIHDRVVFKQEGLDQCLQYDQHPRKSLLDHFFSEEATLESVAQGEATQQGDFLAAPYTAKIRRAKKGESARVQVQLSRKGVACGVPVTITKGVTLEAGSPVMQVAYLLEGLPRDRPLHFAVEFNFAGLPAGAEDRYFSDAEGQKLGHLGSRLDLNDTTGLGITDEWLGIDLQLTANRPTRLWTFPVETVSQSEGGFELVHQSVVVMPHWFVQGDHRGRWMVTMDVAVNTRLAGSPVSTDSQLVANV